MGALYVLPGGSRNGTKFVDACDVAGLTRCGIFE